MKQIQIIRRSIEDTDAVWHETDDIVALLRAEFGTCPSNARLYHKYVSEETDVTPRTQDEERALADMEGPFYFVVNPGTGIEWVPVLVSLAISAASMLLQMIFAPTPPTATQRQVRDESPNNGLSERTNQARVNGRIPYIVGEVRSTPDLVAGVYKIFQNHREKEVAYMCIGEGEYEILDVRDDTTPVSQIAGTSVEIFGPNTSPNSGDAPQLRIGDPINTPVITTQRVNAVNGQTLLAQDSGRVVRRQARFEYPNIIRSLESGVDYTEYFVSGDTISVTEAAQSQGTYSYHPPNGATFDAESGLSPTWGEVTFEGNFASQWSSGQIMTLSNGAIEWMETTGGDSDFEYRVNGNVTGVYPVISASQTGGFTTIRLDVRTNSGAWGQFRHAITPVEGNPTFTRPSGVVQFNLAGTYVVNTVSANVITLNNPSAVNSDWEVMENDYGGQSQTMRPVISTSGVRWVGWFNVEMQEPIHGFIANVLALNGLYVLDDDGTQRRINVAYRIEAQRLDENGSPVGSVQTYDSAVSGSATTRTSRASTLRINLGGAASRYWRFRARRITPTSTAYIQVVDTIQWRDMYAFSNVAQAHFGNVTTLHAVTFATDGALAVKERKTNCLVVRKLPILQADGTFGAPAATRELKDIFCALCFDPKIGNRSPSEVDLQNVYDTNQAIKEYFGFPEASHFSYTFDKSDMSFEETASATAEAVFCRAYRRGSVLRLFFERETDESSILFNHRNTIPGTEKRTVSFGPTEGYDGVALQYISPIDDTVKTLYLPDQNVVNPKTIETIGVRRDDQAHLHAWREWNKIRFQHTTVERECLQEADMLVLGERVTLSDTTRSGEQAGYVVAVDGLLLQLSQPVEWPAGVTEQYVFIQNSDAVVEAIPIEPGPTPTSILLTRAPRTPVVTAGAAPTRYIIGSDLQARQAQPFLVTGKEPGDGMTITLSCVNYDARYYLNDGDFRS